VKLRENLKDHPIQSILTGLASLATIIGFIFLLRTEACNKESGQEKHQAVLNPTIPEEKDPALPNPDIKIKGDSSTIKVDSTGGPIPKKVEKVVSNKSFWSQERSDTPAIKDKETFFLPGEVRMSVMIFSSYSYVNVFFPGETGRSYKREELQLGEEKLFESKDCSYKFYITYLSNSNYSTTGTYVIKVWRRYEDYIEFSL
jgi:hypothetical protein